MQTERTRRNETKSAAAQGTSACDGARQTALAAVAQPVERVLGKDEVMGPIPISSSFVGRSKISARDFRPSKIPQTDRLIQRRENDTHNGQGSFYPD